MKVCPGCHREVADDAEVCACGLRLSAIVAEPVADEARQGGSPAKPNGDEEGAEETPPPGPPRSVYDSGEVDLDELEMDEAEVGEVDLDAVDLDEADLDSEEIDLVESDLDADSTEEVAVAQDEPQPPVSFRREALTRKKPGPPAVIIGAHFVIILAAACIFYYKSTGSSGSSAGLSAPDYNAPQRTYITESNSPARKIEEILARLSLSCHTAYIERESHASPEVTVFLRKYGYRSLPELRDIVETDTVRVYLGIMQEEGRVKTIHVTAQAMLSRDSGWENALVVSFDRSHKLSGKQKPREILAAFGAHYHPQLIAKK